MKDALVGLKPLLGVSLRQEARGFVPWIGLISLLSVSSILAYIWIFPDQASRMDLAATISANPAMNLIFGRPGDLLTPEGFNTWRALALGGFFASLMTIFIVVGNSRADEDSGQAELLASGVLGRETRLVTAVVMAFIASIVLGVVSFLATILCGAAPMDTFLLCLTFSMSGMMFAAVGALAAQIASDARTANAIAVTVLGALFIARGYVDASGAGEWATWLTPTGWMQQATTGSGATWWPFVVAAVFVVLTLACAFVLHARRDFGAGLITARPGPARGGWSSNLWGLALRLNLGSVISWMIVFVVVGFVFGYLTTSISDLFVSDPAIAKILASGARSQDDLLFGFVGTILQLVGIIASVSGVQIVMRIYTEETDFRAEPVLTGSLTRTTYFASNALVAFLTPAIALLIGSTVVGVVSSALEPAIDAGDVITQGLVTIPAVWTLVALALLVVGVEPRRRIAGWMGIVATFALTLLGPMFNLWPWVLGISPLRQVPNVTSGGADWTGWWIVIGVTAVFTVGGFAGYRRRDINSHG